MKKFLIGLLAVFVLNMPAFGWVSENVQTGWKSCRTRTATDDTPLLSSSATLRSWSLKPSAAKPLYSASSIVGINFCLTADADTATYSVYVYRGGSDAELVCTGTITCGTMARADGGLYADTITVTDTWLTTVSTSNAGGGNQMATLWFDCLGASYVYVELSSRTNSSSVGCDYTWVN